MINIIMLTLSILLLLNLPGLIFCKLLFPNRKFTFIESISVYFSFGVSLFIFPMTISYVMHYSWNYFLLMWLAEIIIIILMIIQRKINPFYNLFFKIDKFDFLLLFMFCVVAIAMFIHGGHFIADAASHLSYIMKLANNEIIDPYTPMFKNIKEIPFAYAYCIWYGIIAFITRVTGIELKIIWDLSPAIFSFYVNSALCFFSGNIFNDKKFVLLSLICFFFYEYLYSWSDFKFLPYPDQIARNIFLFIGLGSLFYKVKNNKDLYLHAFFIGIITSLMTLTHIYSTFAFLFISFMFIIILQFFKKEKMRQKQLVITYFIAFIINLPFLLLRLLFSNFYYHKKFIKFIFN